MNSAPRERAAAVGSSQCGLERPPFERFDSLGGALRGQSFLASLLTPLRDEPGLHFLCPDIHSFAGSLCCALDDGSAPGA